MSPPALVRLGIRVRRDRAEEAFAALLPVLAGGAEETEPAPGEVEYAIYGTRAALPSEGAVRALAGDALCGVVRTAVSPGWARAWHAHVRPVRVEAGGRRLRVRAPWQEASSADLELVIDPGDTFGLGGHPTTRLCLELLLRREPDGALCDWGTGSGVLAVAAARLGWRPVVAVDDDAAAVGATRRNARANGVDVDVRRVDLVATASPPWAPTVCANLPFEVQQRLAAGRLPCAPQLLIVSGMLASRADATAAAWAAHGLAETARRTADGWAGLVLERP